ncbi:WGR domain-containing protein [Celeribacter sp. PS-C1]|uniref:WGR domain-containing protein n=1 Tax=Celeribacter sp. PS-C1 TaxID=2820813 RepID=UPI001C66A138|nr:WGR domain-containing protein [Celeribacter sp. PS-C1]
MSHIHSDADGFSLSLDLKRIEPDMNMRRYYRMTIQRDLFGRASLMREWGRIGFRGQLLIDTHEDVEMAAGALRKLAGQKMKRGYVPAAKAGEEALKSFARAPNEHGRDAAAPIE